MSFVLDSLVIALVCLLGWLVAFAGAVLMSTAAVLRSCMGRRS